MSVPRQFDVIVLGGGTMGTAAAWALGKRGLRALVLERFHHVHDQGGHGGETRSSAMPMRSPRSTFHSLAVLDHLWQDLEAAHRRAGFGAMRRARVGRARFCPCSCSPSECRCSRTLIRVADARGSDVALASLSSA